MSGKIIHPDIEPGVIDNDMIIQCILDYGPTEEAGRLFAEEGVHIDEAPIVRIEFKNILRIDHLWTLKSLTKLILAHNLIEKIENLELLTNLIELDLSFNKITKIENLECLVNLEILSLFHNRIRKLENLEELKNLLVFSIGDNLIEDYKEMIYMRQFLKLRSVSFKGNPCCSDPQTNYFLKVALPRVTYLDYKTIKDEDREEGRSLFRGLMRRLDEADELAEKKRIAQQEYDAKVEFYALSFVEYLSGPELIESMFEKDADGTLLMQVGGELNVFYEKYKENYVKTMDYLVEFAQDAYTDRQNEIKLFKDLVDNALKESVKKSKVVVAEFEAKKKIIHGQLEKLIETYRERTTVDPKAKVDDLETKLVDLTENYNDLLYELWKALMTLEIQLFEQCEESRVQFSVNIMEKLNKLMDVVRAAFGAWREHDGEWIMSELDYLTKQLGNKVALGDASPELIEVMTDRDMMMNAVATSSDSHSRFIDAREDVLMSRAGRWKDDLVNGTNDNEIKRNRDRILEINFFIDNLREEWSDMQASFNEPVDPETAALLGDEY